MRLTVGMLKQIIKEEVAKAAGTRRGTSRKGLVREFGMPAEMGDEGYGEEETHFIEIPDIPGYLEDTGESLDEFVSFIEDLALQFGNNPEGPEGGPAYSDEYESIHIMGSKENLTNFADALDIKLSGGQSVEEESRLKHLIEPL